MSIASDAMSPSTGADLECFIARRIIELHDRTITVDLVLGEVVVRLLAVQSLAATR
jgi:hypothetical protein